MDSATEAGEDIDIKINMKWKRMHTKLAFWTYRYLEEKTRRHVLGTSSPSFTQIVVTCT